MNYSTSFLFCQGDEDKKLPLVKKGVFLLTCTAGTTLTTCYLLLATKNALGAFLSLPVMTQKLLKLINSCAESSSVGKEYYSEMVGLMPVEARAAGDENMLFTEKVE